MYNKDDYFYFGTKVYANQQKQENQSSLSMVQTKAVNPGGYQSSKLALYDEKLPPILKGSNITKSNTEIKSP